MMHAVIVENPGKEGRYHISECPVPVPASGQVLIKVAYAGVNRADLLQKQGKYPPPTGGLLIPGMELSGEIIGLGEGAGRYMVGDKVCALVSEGAFANIITVDEGHVLPVPLGVSLEQAAALPEACFTIWISLMWQAHLKPGQSVLIHGGTSGIGSIGIQIAASLGARVFATAGSQEKCALSQKLGAELAVNYKETDFVAAIKAVTEGKGVDVILDMVGGDYFERNLQALAHGGRLAIIAFQKGAKVDANLAPILLKHLQITGSTLRSRPAEQKAKLAREVEAGVWPGVANGTIKSVIDRIFPLKEAEKALQHMDQGLNIGKILIKM
jgi:putative PIG3 family NAD(P)H quinone oxidoreductase